ncbi:CopG family ribbon-helix-helix protein [Magnetospirillum aberrantis]|uniref:CopG family transcriptional regulator n=1 Tax=Magnetospirillum aberrantis SpK TaxID=908842 RepID=A0A7C9UZB8_9PROT|nr:CopG family transcriptional regulator [Magnetospirillum aberrantis]NFV82130.1 CopG family transcriptional regulator [Magnetospirillum aberrantis SpK]
MQKDVTITARIESDLSDRLTRLATIQGRSKSWVVGKALQAYIDTELAFVEAVEDGLADLHEGRTVAHEEVVSRFRQRFGAAE